MNRGFWRQKIIEINGRYFEMEAFVFFPSTPRQRPVIEIKQKCSVLRPAIIPKLELPDANKIYTFKLKTEKGNEDR